MLTLHDPYSHGVLSTSSLLIEMVKAQIGGKHIITARWKYPWQMWDEECRGQVTWK
jgi:hypothetical protein